jgi:hypothetical protein
MNQIFDEPILMNQILDEPILMNWIFDEHGLLNRIYNEHGSMNWNSLTTSYVQNIPPIVVHPFFAQILRTYSTRIF